MHEEKILGNTPKILASFSFLKVGVPPLENQYFSTFQRGTPTFKNETKTRQVVFWGYFPIFVLHA